MELRQLQYFLAIAKYGSLTKAAKALYVTQPALSTSLKSLETELGVPLFDRSRKTLILNENGSYFEERIAAAMAIIDEACRSLTDPDFTRERVINCVHNIPFGNTGAVIKAFRTANPDIMIRFGGKDSTMFQGETIDLTLFGSPVKMDDPNVIELGWEPYVVIVSKGHRLAHRRDVALSDLAKEQFGFTEPSDLFDSSVHLCRAAGFEPKIAFQSQTMNEVVDFVAADLGVAIAGRFTWLYQNHDDVVLLPIRNSSFGRYLYARFSEDHAPSEATWIFIDFLKDFARKLNGHEDA